MSEIGPTGEFPSGKLRDDDKGELKIAVGLIRHPDGYDLVHLHFGCPCEWLALDAESARALGARLIRMANTMERPT